MDISKSSISKYAQLWVNVIFVLWPIWLGISVGAVLILVFNIGSGMDAWREHQRTYYSIVTDAETGCQYMARQNTLTPRLDSSGKHICLSN